MVKFLEIYLKGILQLFYYIFNFSNSNNVRLFPWYLIVIKLFSDHISVAILFVGNDIFDGKICLQLV